jgi:hypothetical protein
MTERKNLFYSLRSMMKLRFLPNVTQLRIQKLGYNANALAFGIVKVNRSMESTKDRRVTLWNAYLRRQYVRLFKYALMKDYTRFEILADKLMKNSYIYRLTMLHHVDPDWFLAKEKDIRKFMRQMGDTVLSEDSNLKYTRNWIDKKPGDAARPIGAPRKDWKVILLMRLQILEICYKANGVIQPWQHCGVSRKGLNTAWKDVITRVLKYKYIYEFDLRGFFDRVKNQNVLPELKTWNRWFDKMSNSQPSKYNLPPKEQDEAVAAFLAAKPSNLISEARRGIPLLTMRIEDNTTRPQTFLNPQEDALAKFDAQQSQRLARARNLGIMRSNGIANAHAYKNVIGKKATLLDNYKDLIMFGKVKPTTMAAGTEYVKATFTEKDRALGRDSWKGLGVTNFGFPQGANTSPFLSCLQVMRAVGPNNNIVMYMDDGLLFADTMEELKQVIASFKKSLETINCSLAEEKSRLICNGDGILLKSKFLGIETDGQSLNSKTRKGKEEAFKGPVTIENYEKLSYYFNLTPSNTRVVKNWLLTDRIKNKMAAIEWAIEHGFLSNIIAEAFNPNMEGVLQGIEGSNTKYYKILDNKGLALEVRNNLLNPSNEDDIKIYSTYATIQLLKSLRKVGNGKRR